MFYNIFESLCHRNGTSPFAVCREIGLNGSTASYWKKSGKTPKRETLEKIAEKFNVTVDYLLQKNQPPEPIALRASEKEWLYVLSRMSDDSLVKLRDYTRYLLWLQGQASEDFQESHQ